MLDASLCSLVAPGGDSCHLQPKKLLIPKWTEWSVGRNSLYDVESVSQIRQPKPSGVGGPLGHRFHKPINLPSAHGIGWCWLLSLVTEEP